MKKLLFAIILGSSGLMGCDELADLYPSSEKNEEVRANDRSEKLKQNQVERTERREQRERDREVSQVVAGAGTYTCTFQDTVHNYTLYKPGRLSGRVCEAVEDESGSVIWYANHDANFCERELSRNVARLQAQGFSCN